MRLMWFEHMTAQAIGPGLVQITTQATQAKAEARCRDVVDSHQRFPPAGASQDDAIAPFRAQHHHRDIRVSVWEIYSSTISAMFTYDQPQVSIPHLTNAPATGSTSITIFGNNFAQHEYSQQARLGAIVFTGYERVGATACEATTWVSDSNVICKHPSGSSHHRLSLIHI